MVENVFIEDLPAVLAGLEHEFEADAGASRVDAIAGWERVIRYAQAMQLEQINGFYADRARETGLFDGDPALQVIGQVSLARNVSPGAAGTQFGVAIHLAHLPQVSAALRDGLIGEPSVRAICRASAGLSRDDLTVFDAEIGPRLSGLTPRRAGQLAERIVISLDPELAAEQAEKHRKDVRVDLISHSDGVATLMATGPAEPLVAAYEALRARATGKRVEGDEDTPFDQLLFDTLVERLTGAHRADDTTVEVGIVIDLATLLGTSDQPVELVGHGPIAPAVADTILDQAHRIFYRRLITDPITGTLIARDERRRRFTGALAGFIRARDRHRCRQPGCDCRIRDLDHVQAYSAGGPTTEINGEGLCRRSHTFKHLPGWTVTTRPDGTITWRTPTGHTYRSKTPSLDPLAA